MREYILTERERELVQEVLRGEKPDSFRVLKTRAQKAMPTLEGDMQLLKRFLEKV